MVILGMSPRPYFIQNICGARAYGIHLAELDHATSSRTAAGSLGENYASIPLE